MATRSAVRGARTYLEPGVFGWGMGVAAVLRHSSLPWREALDAVPLAALPPVGGRDRLSLVAQFAAHQALLQFAGVSDGACDAAEWAVVQRRGVDARLVRLTAAAATDVPPALTLVQQFAEAVGAPPLDALRLAHDRVLVLGETPSPLAPLREIVLDGRTLSAPTGRGAQRAPGSDAEIVERIVAAERLIVIVKDFERFDADARRVVELLA